MTKLTKEQKARIADFHAKYPPGDPTKARIRAGSAMFDDHKPKGKTT